MAIKRNTQIILLTLFSAEQASTPLVPLPKLRNLSGNLTESGFRSLLLFLEKKHFIFREKVLSTSSYSLTEEGRRELITLFPALDSKWQAWQGKWSILVFLKAPINDNHFRYLRELLLVEKTMVLSRGIYLVPGDPSSRLLKELENSYRGAVSLFSIDKAFFGWDRQSIVSYYDLTSIVEAYSGISNEISLLLDKINYEKGLTNQQKNMFIKINNRFISSLQGDPGIVHYYFPGLPGARQILSQLNKIISL